MLETEEVDDDYFTPIPSTSLADIFGNNSHTDSEIGNTSLTYTSLKPQNVSSKPVESKATQCIFACALLAYEWFNNVYSAKGKLGFAILKTLQTNEYNIVLYDSSKRTLSLTNISAKLEITVKGDVYISFYDKCGKYWSLYGTQEEISKITDYLKNLKVNIIQSPRTEATLPGPNLPEHNIMDSVYSQCHKEEQGSDTDSSINTQTKASILSRMANMGHSVMPPQVNISEKTSDSSDTNETHDSTLVRHKAVKNIVKRNTSDRNIHEIKNTVDMSKLQTLSSNCLYSYINGQLVPVTNTNVISNASSNNDMNVFISEQRISNSELRININRINDKVDQVLEKIKNVNHTDNSSTTHFQEDILQKLLSEYEKKIKSYEELLKSNDVMCNRHEMEMCQNKISELELMNKNKDIEISKLKRQLEVKNEEIQNIHSEKNISSTYNYSNIDLENKIKNIMNDLYQTISINFDRNINYSGDTVRNKTATLIKQITTKSLSDL